MQLATSSDSIPNGFSYYSFKRKVAIEEGLHFLDSIEKRLLSGDVAQGTLALFNGLHKLRQTYSMDNWIQFASYYCRRHPLFKILHEDPFSRRAFEKPRGYAGDAVMMDYIYAPEELGPMPLKYTEVSSLGKAIYGCTSMLKAAIAVRTRLKFLAEKIEHAAVKLDNPQILSVACGHMREVLHAGIMGNMPGGRFIGLDADLASLQTIHEQVSPRITTIHATIKDLIQGKVMLSGGFDLIYSAGLFDYLKEPHIYALCAMLFKKLNPGGTLLVGNFMPNTDSSAYMEAFMDWWLVYRDEERISRFAEALDESEIHRMRTYVQSDQNIGYLEVQKR